MLHPDDRPLWELTHPSYLWDVDLADGFEITVAGTTCGRCTRRATLRGRSASTPDLGVACSPATRCSRRAWRDRALLQRRRPDQAVDPGEALRAARRDRGPHRTRGRRRSARRRRASEPDDPHVPRVLRVLLVHAERADEQGCAAPGDPGQHDRGGGVPGQGESRLRSCSGTTLTPRFLIMYVPTPRSRRAPRRASRGTAVPRAPRTRARTGCRPARRRSRRRCGCRRGRRAAARTAVIGGARMTAPSGS